MTSHSIPKRRMMMIIIIIIIIIIIWQGLLEYAKHAYDIIHKNSNGVVVYDDALGNYDKI